jgi:Putative zinc-finger
MSCGDWEDRIALYAGGDLGPADAQALEGHLAECAGCQLLLSGLRENLGWLRDAHDEPVEAAHFAAVRARVLAKLEPRGRERWRYAWLYAMAVAAVVLVVAVWPRPPRILVLPMPPAPAAAVAQVVRAPVARAIQATHRKRARRVVGEPEEKAGPLLVELVTDDPDIVIYWIADSKGESK